MQLTTTQAHQLRTSLRFREHPPTVWWYVRANWRVYVHLVVMCGIGIGGFLWADWPVLSAFFAGIFFMAIARDLRYFSQFVKGWPLSNEITNWEKVHELLDRSERTAPQHCAGAQP